MTPSRFALEDSLDGRLAGLGFLYGLDFGSGDDYGGVLEEFLRIVLFHVVV